MTLEEMLSRDDVPADLRDAVRRHLTEYAGREAQLRASEERLRSLIEETTDAVFCYEYDPPIPTSLPPDEQIRRFYDGVLADCNLVCARSYGASERSTVIGKRLTELFGTTPGSLDGLFRSVIEGGYRIVDGEGVERLPDGTTRHFLNNAHGVIEDGRLLRIWGTYRDITDRRQTEVRLRESEERYRRIVTAAQEGIWELDEHDVVTFVNARMAEMLGYEVADISGRPADLFLLNEDVEAHREEMERRRAGRTATYERRLRRKDGSWLWALMTGVPLLSPEERYVGAFAMVTDITERKRAEEALRQSEERLSSLIDSAADSIYLLDADLHFVEINRRGLEIIGRPKTDVIGKALAEIVPDVVTSGRCERHREVLRTGVPFVVEDFIPHPVFGDMHVMLKSFRVGDGLGVIATDVTELKHAEAERRRLEAQVQHAQKLESLGVLAGGIAHDFNNLLVSVLGNASLVLRSLPTESPARKQTTDIEAAARRASDLCGQLLAYSGRGTFLVQVVDLNHLVEEMVQLLRVSISKKADLQLHLAAEPTTVRADVTQLRQIVLNLVVNASEALAEHAGTITIATGMLGVGQSSLPAAVPNEPLPEGRYVFLEVADTGVGMDDATRRRLFDPFFTTKVTGRGLGLSAVLGIVSGHHGSIVVESTPGLGTAFRVFLPEVESAKVTAEPETVRDAHLWTGEGTVLIVDDEPFVLEVVGQMIERLGFSRITAPNGQAGLDLFNAHTGEIRAALLDLSMPHLGGEELMRELRARRPDLPVILMSGYDEQGTMSQATLDDVAGFLHKPFDLATFAVTLRRALEEPDSPAARPAASLPDSQA